MKSFNRKRTHLRNREMSTFRVFGGTTEIMEQEYKNGWLAINGKTKKKCFSTYLNNMGAFTMKNWKCSKVCI